MESMQGREPFYLQVADQNRSYSLQGNQAAALATGPVVSKARTLIGHWVPKGPDQVAASFKQTLTPSSVNNLVGFEPCS